MNILSPSILASDFAHLAQQAKAVADGGAAWLHIDVMDGLFVPNITLGAPIVKSLRPYSDLVFDVHLMIDRPERYIADFAKAGSDIITFHIESTDCPKDVIDTIHAAGKKAGITLKPATDVAEILPYLSDVELVLVMTVEPGFGGQSFMADMLEKVRKLKEIRTQKAYSYDIEVDGGVTLENVGRCLQAGANVMVAGSSVYRGDATHNAAAFMRILQEGNE